MKQIDPTVGWYNAQELAGLPGMPKSDSAVMRSAKKNLWVTRRKLRGKGDEYALRSLPEVTRNYILGLALNLSPVATPAPSVVSASIAASGFMLDEITSVTTLASGVVAVRGQLRRIKDSNALDDKDRSILDASLILCRAVEAAQAATDCSVKKACQALAERLVEGNVHHELLTAAHVAYVKPRKGAGPLGGVYALSERLAKMMSFFERGRLAGDVCMYLIPGKTQKAGHNPVHVAAFLRFYCRPTRPPVSETYRNMKPWMIERGLDVPSYSTVTRIENELPVTVKYRGRVTGSEWRGLKPYVDRDVSMFYSNDIWVGDGHSFKAKVAHPIHGQPFTPEITFIIDWVSRKIVGWSVALSESTVAVSDAFRHAQQQTRARPLIYYSDNGSGQTGKMIDHPIFGTLARQGIGHETGIPGHPQARGIIERIWQITLIALARTYPTCTWRGADENTVNRMLKALNKKDGGGIAIPSFAQLLIDVDACVTRYNLEHEHSALDGATPEDQYQRKLDKDSIVFGPDDGEIKALWRPEEIRKPQRGLVNLFGNEYCKRDLVDLLPKGASVRVQYDLHDADKVWLFTMDGRPLGVATWNGHKTAAFPESKMDQLRQARADGKVKRGEKIIAEAQAELGEVIDMTPSIPAPSISPDVMPVWEAREEEELLPFSETVRELWGNQPAEDENDDADNFKVAVR